jgi:hypothetical protein
MIEMILVWSVIPLLLTLLCSGFGLAFLLLFRKSINFTFTVIIGFLLMAILGSVTVISTTTAPYTAMAFGLISVAGLVSCAIWYRSRFHFDYLPLFAGSITYLSFALPTLAYGRPSWVGWIKLDDDSTFLAVTDRLMNVGRTVPVPVVSTFDRVLQTIFASGSSGHFSYPVGTFIPFGVISKLTGVEKAWFYQPYLSFAAALMAMIFVVILSSRISNRYLVVAIASISSLAATIYSYVMWGGIKEIVIIVPIVFFAFLVFQILASPKAKELYWYAIVAFLGIFVIGGVASFGYAAPVLLVAVLLVLWRKNRRYFHYFAGVSGLVAAALIFLVRSGNKAVINLFIPIIGDNGNLSKSLNMGQILGIWPSQDFRLDPVVKPLTFSIIAIAIIFVIAGLYFSAVKSQWLIPALLTSSAAVVATSYLWGGIWLTGKAIAVASPLFLLAAFVGMYESWLEFGKESRQKFAPYGARTVVIVLASLVVSGVIVSDAFTYKNVSLAPNLQQDELRSIGQMFAGQGPALMTEYSVYGSRYFLRNIATEAASELRVHVIPTRDGNQLPKGSAADIDFFDPATIDYFNLLVLRKAPNASRPPLDYGLAWSGKHYEVWKKIPGVFVRKTLPLGSIFYPGAVPTCQAVKNFLADRAATERTYAAVRKPVYVVDFTAGVLPANFLPLATYSGGVHFSGPGAFNRNFTVGETGQYDMWIAGSYPGRLRILVDGREVFSGHSVFEGNLYLTNPLSNVQLSVGAHVLTVLYDSPLLLPGTDLPGDFGPIYFSSQTAIDVRVKRILNSRISELCTQNLDWIAIAN